MTTITIERDKVERWLSALEVATRFVYQDNRPECEAAVEDLRTALAAPATAPEPRYSLVPMGEPPHRSKAWIAPLSGKVSAIPVEGFVMLDKDMREWAQARKMHVCWAGGWHVMIGKTWCTTGCDTPGRAVEACWESGEYDDLEKCAALSAPERKPMTLDEIKSNPVISYFGVDSGEKIVRAVEAFHKVKGTP